MPSHFTQTKIQILTVPMRTNTGLLLPVSLSPLYSLCCSNPGLRGTFQGHLCLMALAGPSPWNIPSSGTHMRVPTHPQVFVQMSPSHLEPHSSPLFLFIALTIFLFCIIYKFVFPYLPTDMQAPGGQEFFSALFLTIP